MCTHKLSDKLIATGSLDKTIRIWNLETKECIKVLSAHKDCVTAITSFEDNQIVSSSDDTTIILWNINNALALKKFGGHTVF